MKKVFISCPMKDRTRGAIEESMLKMTEYAENFLEEEIEVIPTYIEETPENVKNEALWYLGESIKKLSEADVFVGMSAPYDYAGCHVETITARDYNIPIISIPDDYIFTKAEREEVNKIEMGCTPF